MAHLEQAYFLIYSHLAWFPLLALLEGGLTRKEWTQVRDTAMQLRDLVRLFSFIVFGHNLSKEILDLPQFKADVIPISHNVNVFAKLGTASFFFGGSLQEGTFVLWRWQPTRTS